MPLETGIISSLFKMLFPNLKKKKTDFSIRFLQQNVLQREMSCFHAFYPGFIICIDPVYLG